MPGATPIYGFPYPDPSDLVANYPALGQDLAEDIETVIAALGSGLNLITPTTIANSGGTATATGGAVNFSSVNSVSLNGVFSSTYENYHVIFSADSNTGNQLNCRLRVGGVDASGSNYDHQIVTAFGSAAQGVQSTNVDTMRVMWITSADGVLVQQLINRPNLTERTRFVSHGGGGTELNVVAGDHDLSTAYDGITYLPQSGNTLTGTVRVYGLKN
jgi:hypothetical protein